MINYNNMTIGDSNCKLQNQFFIAKPDGSYRVMNNTGFSTILTKKTDEKFYEVFQGYDNSDEGIKAFAIDFELWATELRQNPIIKIFYNSYKSNSFAVELTFKRLCKNKYEHHTPITQLEAQWFDGCHNGGLTSCVKGIHQSYGYDFSSFYPMVMASKKLMIPNKEGVEMTLEELPKKLNVGFYRVKIQCDNVNFRKIFAFSKSETYTNYSIDFALKYQKKFDVTIELILDDLPNAYVYDSVESSNSIFGKWYEDLSAIKKLYPKNKLIKHLMTSLWGHLNQQNKIRKSAKQINDEKLDVGNDEDSEYYVKSRHFNDKGGYYTLVNNKTPYKYNIRLMPFLMAMARNITAKIALTNIDSVIRICTDNVTFDQPMKDEYENLLPEDKTTGLIDWQTHAKYTKVENADA